MVRPLGGLPSFPLHISVTIRSPSLWLFALVEKVVSRRKWDLSNGNPVWTVVIHIVWSFVFCWSEKALHSSLELSVMVSPPPTQFVLDLWRCIGNPVVFRPSPRPSSLLSPLPCWHHLSPVQHSCGPVWTSRSYRLLVLSVLSDFCLVCSSNPSSSFYWFLPGISGIVSRPGGLGVHVDVLWRMLT